MAECALTPVGRRGCSLPGMHEYHAVDPLKRSPFHVFKGIIHAPVSLRKYQTAQIGM